MTAWLRACWRRCWEGRREDESWSVNQFKAMLKQPVIIHGKERQPKLKKLKARPALRVVRRMKGRVE